ncbi:hypothetical protein PIB30_063669 [Stylosanthes scabra]|uniref:Uncharacterized protein n=1 Tax=Stylosanthes scabra TaxID=79078 RepID=A0ABU6RLV4_9FABA|nr:hypothetical protein [Stylosanthes scabra]
MDDFDGYSSQGIPSFSLCFSQEFKSPIHTPKRSMHEEILDIPPINEMILANIPFQEVKNPTNMGPTRELTADEQKKIYNWIMNVSREDGVQEEMIASFHGYRNIFLLRMEFRYLKPRKWINSSIINWKIKEFNNSNLSRFTNEFYCVESGILDTILTDRNSIAYETRGNSSK